MLFWMMASMMVPLAVVMLMVVLVAHCPEVVVLVAYYSEVVVLVVVDQLRVAEEEGQLQVGEVEAQLQVAEVECQLLAAAIPIVEVDCVTVVVVEHLLAEAVVPLEVVEVEPAYLCCRVGLWLSETNLIGVEELRGPFNCMRFFDRLMC